MELDIYAQQAHSLVDAAIGIAMKQLEEELPGDEPTKTALHTIPLDDSREGSFIYEEHDVKNIAWLTIDEFTEKKGEEKIHEFIKTWQYENGWLYCIDYLGVDEASFDYRHRYRVRWSIPTRRKPVPKATASVYFTFQISKIKPKNYPVEVYYVFETNTLVHRPGKSRFREVWLKDIIESKAQMMRFIDY
ncbi:A-kinase anchor protein 14-like [Tubulanus polymorphus]|uniref:A-kinase anchor protein 14-like n=1 Tax=Tubulanus polymorphus TaxID=672921 RepID=UPI003DA2B554